MRLQVIMVANFKISLLKCDVISPDRWVLTFQRSLAHIFRVSWRWMWLVSLKHWCLSITLCCHNPEGHNHVLFICTRVCVFSCCTSCLLSVTFTFQLQCFVIIACCSSDHVFYVCVPNGYKKVLVYNVVSFFAGLILRVLLITSSTQNRAWHPWVCLGH